MKNLYFIISAIVIIIYIFVSIRKNKLSVSNSFMWFVFCLVLLFLSIWPKSLDWLADLLGISYPPALFLTVAVVILFILNFIQSKKIEELQKKVINVGQELSVVKEDVRVSKNGK